MRTVEFDLSRAIPRFPIPEPKPVVLVPILSGFPVTVTPEWQPDGLNPQSVRGDCYAVVGRDGKLRYLSEFHAWEVMHSKLPLPPALLAAGVPDMFYVKDSVPPPVGYHVDDECIVYTITSGPGGANIESRVPVKKRTLVLRQPMGELQSVRPEDERATYFEPSHAHRLGLDRMTPQQYQAWALDRATRRLAGIPASKLW